MSSSAHSVTRRNPGAPIFAEATGPQKIISGWVGLYGNTSEEPRLFCALVAGDIISSLEGCYIEALTRVELESSSEAPTTPEILARHCFRLSQYRAQQRMADFLLDIGNRLKAGNGGADTDFEIPLTQYQLGEILGLSTVHINRTLHSLRPLVQIKDRRVYIENAQHLMGMCKHEKGPPN